jgi:hypothetical protein
MRRLLPAALLLLPALTGCGHSSDPAAACDGNGASEPAIAVRQALATLAGTGTQAAEACFAPAQRSAFASQLSRLTRLGATFTFQTGGINVAGPEGVPEHPERQRLRLSSAPKVCQSLPGAPATCRPLALTQDSGDPTLVDTVTQDGGWYLIFSASAGAAGG